MVTLWYSVMEDIESSGAMYPLGTLAVCWGRGRELRPAYRGLVFEFGLEEQEVQARQREQRANAPRQKGRCQFQGMVCPLIWSEYKTIAETRTQRKDKACYTEVKDYHQKVQSQRLAGTDPNSRKISLALMQRMDLRGLGLESRRLVMTPLTSLCAYYMPGIILSILNIYSLV